MQLIAIAISALLADPVSKTCEVSEQRLVRLSEHDFDQAGGGGWRTLAEKGCEAEAAELIHHWRLAHPVHSNMMFWHEGQLRANLGQYPAAMVLFAKSKLSPADDRFGWNPYVEGTIAFLKGDKRTLLSARERLAQLPRPASFPEYSDIMGQRVHNSWPLNLNVLDALIAAWGRPYKEAYRSAAPVFKYQVPG